MTPKVTQQAVPTTAYTIFSNRPIMGIVLHHSAGTGLYQPHAGGSAHRVFMPNGDIVLQVHPAYAAHHVLKTDKWRPFWVAKAPGNRVSDMNYCSLGYEIIYAPQEPHYQVPTLAQYASIQWAIEQDYLTYGILPIVAHGEVQSDKWATEPHKFDYALAHLTSRSLGGRIWTPPVHIEPEPPEEEFPLNPTPEELYSYFSQLGIPCNMETAIMKRAVLSYKRDETRGPAISDEYPAVSPDGRYTIRQRFTAGTLEYDPNTGGLGWVELNINPEA